MAPRVTQRLQEWGRDKPPRALRGLADECSRHQARLAPKPTPAT
eukprot:CAMPEP_0180221536 /NCGR_PEP_ID=MMETSP0987-20121128/19948_1 /TAXON_ID=697907 /ORGANISM="non described non described, Strain CCMP2293" /LENGTH=43 /DNA_ID= /DNA_START= /DNA_END= /DNA_ORIENTATION=